MMKLISSIALMLVVFFLGSPVKNLDATSQEWAGGTYESGYGTNYQLLFKTRGGSDKLAFHDLWVGDKYFQVVAIKELTKRNDLNFEKGDSVYVVAREVYRPDKNGNYQREITHEKACPITFESAALLGYTWKGKQKFLEIKSFRKLEKLIYP